MAKKITISSDEGMQETDKLLSELEKKIKKEYKQAADETEKKLEKYLEKLEIKNEQKMRELAEGKITKEEYQKWYTGKVMIGRRWDEMQQTLATDLAHTSEIARSMTEGYMPEVYALNHNYGTFQVEQGSLVNTSYTLYDRQTVERLIRDNPNLFPQMSDDTARKIREGKLIKWNEQKIQSAVTQGILQGESIPKIAKRMRDVTDMDYRASIRNARTAITSSQNGGRLDAYRRANSLGIKTKKQWLSVHDGKTRHEHAVLDGQIKDIDKPFDAGGYEIMFPGDPSADPAMIYNCRCTMLSAIDGFEKNFSEEFKDTTIGDMSYDEWKKYHEDALKKQPETPQHKVVDGKDISATWHRRPNEFAFEIEDVINAQGFDGVPRVVSAEDFDKAVKESNFIAQRTYSAPDQETLDAYRDQLYNGKWYVDCSTGGANYGQGMYVAGNTNGGMNDSIRNEMTYYIENSFGHQYHAVETMTVTSDFKTIDYKQIKSEFFFKNVEAQYSNDVDIIKAVEHGRAQRKEGVRGNPFYKDIKAVVKSKYGEQAYDELQDFYEKYIGLDAIADEGVMATMMGYDGILTYSVTPNISSIVNAEESQHIVILNRTKVIFKRS